MGRLSNEEFLNGLLSLRRELSPKETIALMKTGLAPRLNPAYAKSVIGSVRHLNAYKRSGVTELKRLIGKSPLCGKIFELEAEICNLKTNKELKQFLDGFKGSYRHKSEMAKSLFGKR